MDEANWLRELEQMYWVYGKELQVLLLATATLPEYWVNVPRLVACAQLLADTHDSLGHCGWDNLLTAMCRSYWWPGMHADIANSIWHCLVCQQNKLPTLPKGELYWTDKGGTPFIRWSINVVGPCL